ncbi:methyltransferase domain-containing protein [Actinomadura rubrisoli]|uniref:Protein-L-isoaspartate O-methyltransferase n=2 Tax=Actinomadura rubrisoli TaxID=2530368 RepID=A0A4R5BGC6_9ACTN|nr:methyltransferase domain-containing protein [Actinomadura rubrisoli]
MHVVPRHLFVPERGYALPCRYDLGPAEHVIDKAADPEQWWAAVYSDMSIITQRDDGASDPTDPEGSASSSISAPGIVFPFLELLGPTKGERILDIGTGTGWTAALLSDRVGAENVTSVEIDPAVAAQAAENLRAAGHTPTLIVGDGFEGWPQGAPYDGIHVTAGVSDIPHAWVKQLRPGGRAVMPWMPEGLGGFQVKLTVNPDGHGIGTIHGRAGYMLLRSQRSSSYWKEHHRGEAQVTTTELPPKAIEDAGDGAELALIMNVPDLFVIRMLMGDGTMSYRLAVVGDPDGPWASIDSSPTGENTVTQYGDRRLWDEAENAFTWWREKGAPGAERFGLLVTEEGTRLWLDDPPKA